MTSSRLTLAWHGVDDDGDDPRNEAKCGRASFHESPPVSFVSSYILFLFRVLLAFRLFCFELLRQTYASLVEGDCLADHAERHAQTEIHEQRSMYIRYRVGSSCCSLCTLRKLFLRPVRVHNWHVPVKRCTHTGRATGTHARTQTAVLPVMSVPPAHVRKLC